MNRRPVTPELFSSACLRGLTFVYPYLHSEGFRSQPGPLERWEHQHPLLRPLPTAHPLQALFCRSGSLSLLFKVDSMWIVYVMNIMYNIQLL